MHNKGTLLLFQVTYNIKMAIFVGKTKNKKNEGMKSEVH